MNKRQFVDMDEPEFYALIDNYITRAAYGYGEMPLEVYVGLLAERMEKEVEETLTLSIDVTNNELTIQPTQERAI